MRSLTFKFRARLVKLRSGRPDAHEREQKLEENLHSCSSLAFNKPYALCGSSQTLVMVARFLRLHRMKMATGKLSRRFLRRQR